MLQLEPARTAWDLRFRLLRVPVRIHPLFWAAALWIVYGSSPRFELVLLGVACVLFSIIVHEFGHALSGRYYGDHKNQVVLYYLGGLCVDRRRPPRAWPNIVHMLWGPGAGLIVAAVAVVLLVLIHTQWIAYPGECFYYVISMLCWINLVWSLLNLLPIFPLDGGQILREIIQWKVPRRGDYLVFTISLLMALGMTVGALAWMFFQKRFTLQQGFLPVMFFGALAYYSFAIRRQLGPDGSLEDEGQRQPWEQDPDWWRG